MTTAQENDPSREKQPLPVEDTLLSRQANNPLHGITLEYMLVALEEEYGWKGLGQRIAIRCFTHDPSIKSSLQFLRRTPWAREKVEMLYLKMQHRKDRRHTGP